MKRLRVIGARLRKAWPKVLVALVIVSLIGLTGYSFSVASGKPDTEDLASEYERGLEEGETRGEASGRSEGEERLKEVRNNAYWNGWEEGYDEGEEEAYAEGQRWGAELATPEDMDFGTRYMVTYEPSANGPVLRSYLEMPLGTLWECDDLDSCTELVP